MDFPTRGEIWLVSLEPVIGSETGKTQPALIISNNRNNEFANTITVIPITSKTDKIYPFEVFVSKEYHKLQKDSKIKTNQIRTVDKKRLVKYLSALPRDKLKEVEQAVLIHLCIS
ncbi:MAG: type II toxin-antitoxin system PemK/MazF family toxin [Candidatus Anammoxibacter sp.]